MPDFKTQITGLTDISISGSSIPTEDEVSQFLVDGTTEVANRIIALKPQEMPKFTASTHDANNSGITVTGDILTVVREHDSTTILRKCIAIDPGLRYEASDPDSLHYRSKYNPGFYILDGKIHTVPVSAGSNNDCIVTQTYYATNTTHASTGIQSFPNEYVYLVVLYAAMKSLQNKMGSMMSDSDLSTAISNANTALDRISDSVYSGIDNYDNGHKRFKSVKKALDNAAKLFDGDFPSTSTDTESFLLMEDPEMVEVRLQAIQIELLAAERALTEMNLIAEIPLKEAQGYMAEVSSRLGILGQDYTWYAGKYQELKKEYDGAFMYLAPQQPKATNEG